MKLVIAGNYQQYRDYLRRTGQSERDVHYLDSVEKAMGMRGSELVLVEKYWRSPVWPYLNHIKALVER